MTTREIICSAFAAIQLKNERLAANALIQTTQALIVAADLPAMEQTVMLERLLELVQDSKSNALLA
jgi:hypothetical protein